MTLARLLAKSVRPKCLPSLSRMSTCGSNPGIECSTNRTAQIDSATLSRRASTFSNTLTILRAPVRTGCASLKERISSMVTTELRTAASSTATENASGQSRAMSTSVCRTVVTAIPSTNSCPARSEPRRRTSNFARRTPLRGLTDSAKTPSRSTLSAVWLWEPPLSH